MRKNVFKIIRSFTGIIGIVLGIAIITIPSYYFIEKDLIIGNLGHSFYISEIILTIIIAILFGLFIGATFYKIKYFSVRKSGAGIFGGFLGVLVAGCPACSITLASYLGLAGIISIFPFFGMELKIISVFLLIYANYSTIKTLEFCRVNNYYKI